LCPFHSYCLSVSTPLGLSDCSVVPILVHSVGLMSTYKSPLYFSVHEEMFDRTHSLEGLEAITQKLSLSLSLNLMLCSHLHPSSPLCLLYCLISSHYFYLHSGSTLNLLPSIPYIFTVSLHRILTPMTATRSRYCLSIPRALYQQLFIIPVQGKNSLIYRVGTSAVMAVKVSSLQIPQKPLRFLCCR
jgi:hypothetical protein